MRLAKYAQEKLSTTQLVLIIALIAFAVLGRLLPHPPNFAPIAAIAIFGGALLPRRLALTLPLTAMILSDSIIGFHSMILFTWGSFAVVALASSKFVKLNNPLSIVAASLSASVFFYLVTNFGVWLEGTMYPMTLSGIATSYYQAMPFFRNTLMGDLVFTTSLFGVYALVSYAVPIKASKQPVSVN